MEEWLEWINRSEGKSSSYDTLAELAVSSYMLKSRSRKAELKDQVFCFIHWWMENKKKMVKYNSTIALGALLGRDHSTVIHYIHKRKPTLLYEHNVRCIRDFLYS
jgi:chromosomal replication initiation ATPase DnaA